MPAGHQYARNHISRTVRRRILKVFAVLGLVAATLTLATPAQADDGGRGVTDARVVQLTTPGSVKGVGSLRAHNVWLDPLIATNEAVALVSCNGCRGVAISFQVVLDGRGPKDVTATNVAYSQIQDCADCGALALAYQFVVVTDQPQRVTFPGLWRLASVDYTLRRLARSDLPLDTITAQADAQAAIVADVLNTQLVPVVVHRRLTRHGLGRNAT